MNNQINRANHLWKNWQAKQQMLDGMFSAGQMPAPNLNRQKYQFLQKGIARIGINATPDERIVLELLKGITAKLEKQLYPNRFIRLLMRVKQLVYDQPKYLKRQAVLHSENLATLQTYLAAKGMASFSGKLESYLDYERDKVDVSMSSQLSGSKRLDVTLHLQQDQNGRYQIPHVTAAITDRAFPAQQREFTFEGNGWISIKTAANLLEGRPVSASLPPQPEQQQGIRSWLQLDFTGAADGKAKLQEYAYDYGFDLDTALKELAKVTGIPALSVEKVHDHLLKGDAVTFKCPASGEALFLQADPGDKSILIKNQDQQVVPVATLVQRQEAVKKQDKANSQKLSRNRVRVKNKEPENTLSVA